jgi:predicted DsbA family dithiol-disulfide isomerase
MSEAPELGIDGTPIFVLGIRKPRKQHNQSFTMIEGGYPYEVLKATLDMLIATQN